MPAEASCGRHSSMAGRSRSACSKLATRGCRACRCSSERPGPAPRGTTLLRRGFAGRFGDAAQLPPKIAAISGRGRRSRSTSWIRRAVAYPSQTEITSSNGQFDPVERPSRVSLLGYDNSLSLARRATLAESIRCDFVSQRRRSSFFFAYRRRAFSAVATIIAGVLLASSRSSRRSSHGRVRRPTAKHTSRLI